MSTKNHNTFRIAFDKNGKLTEVNRDLMLFLEDLIIDTYGDNDLKRSVEFNVQFLLEDRSSESTEDFLRRLGVILNPLLVSYKFRTQSAQEFGQHVTQRVSEAINFLFQNMTKKFIANSFCAYPWDLLTIIQGIFDNYIGLHYPQQSLGELRRIYGLMESYGLAIYIDDRIGTVVWLNKKEAPNYYNFMNLMAMDLPRQMRFERVIPTILWYLMKTIKPEEIPELLDLYKWKTGMY